MASINPESNTRGPGTHHNTARMVLDAKAQARASSNQIAGAELAVVDHYDFETGRASVFLKDSPGSPPYDDIPVMGPSSGIGSFAVIAPLPRGSVGLLIPLHRDAAMSFGDREVGEALTPRKNRGDAWVFLPGEPRFSSEPIYDFISADATAEHRDLVGPDDLAIIGPGGSRLVFKSDGAIVSVGSEVLAGKHGTAPGSYNDTTKDNVA